MFEAYKINLEYGIRIRVNNFFRFLRALPLLKRLAPGKDYSFSKLKSLFFVVSPLANFIFDLPSILIQFAILGLVLRLLYIPLSQLTDLDLFTWVLSSGLWFYWFTALLSHVQYMNKEKHWQFYSFFYMNPRKTILGEIFFMPLSKALVQFALLALVGGLAKAMDPGSPPVLPLVLAFRLPFLIYLTQIIGNGIHVALAKRGIFPLETKAGPLLYVFFLIGGIGGMVLALSLFNINLLALAAGPWSLLVLPVALFSGVYLYKYPHYLRDLKILGQGIEDIYGLSQKGQQEALKQRVALKDQDLEGTKDLAGDLEGYGLLNELFFQRHRRLLLKPVLIKAGILALLLSTLFIIPLTPWVSKGDFGRGLGEFLPSVAAYAPLMSYLLFNQEFLTRTFFINCDQALLQYGFYSRPKDLLRMFTLRLRKTILWNSLINLVLTAYLVLLTLYYGLDPKEVLILALQLLGLMVFFSVHTLFVYYIFQPYTGDKDVKSPSYHVVSLGVYLFSYLTMMMGTEFKWMAPLFIGLALIYSVVALVLVYKKAPQTFRLKED
ncbi:MAG: hypothetical protein Q4E37_00595 [Tissierellia bacterium]|nr:hypothetical protein [Tissierellia bacterium]